MLKRVAIALFTIVAVVYLGAALFLYVMQRDFQYEPDGEVWEIAETALQNTEQVEIANGDGSGVTGWFAPPAPGKPLILFYRGNSGSFTHEHERFERWTAEGYGFLSFDYRGFPLSPGAISQQAILEDSLAAFDWAAAKGHRIIIWGRSLGTGPATYVAGEREAAALLLESPFYSAVAVAAERYGFLPVGLLMHDQFPVNEWILAVEEPVFVAHGTADSTIGVSHGERVYAIAPNAKELWIEPGAGHSDLWARGIWDRAKAFFDTAGQ